MGYRLNRLDEPIFMPGPKPLRTEFGIHQRLESCVELTCYQLFFGQNWPRFGSVNRPPILNGFSDHCRARVSRPPTLWRSFMTRCTTLPGPFPTSLHPLPTVRRQLLLEIPTQQPLKQPPSTKLLTGSLIWTHQLTFLFTTVNELENRRSNMAKIFFSFLHI